MKFSSNSHISDECVNVMETININIFCIHLYSFLGNAHIRSKGRKTCIITKIDSMCTRSRKPMLSRVLRLVVCTLEFKLSNLDVTCLPRDLRVSGTTCALFMNSCC